MLCSSCSDRFCTLHCSIKLKDLILFQAIGCVTLTALSTQCATRSATPPSVARTGASSDAASTDVRNAPPREATSRIPASHDEREVEFVGILLARGRLEGGPSVP